MSPARILQIVVLLWPVSEVILGLATRTKSGAAKAHDRGSLAILWIVITAGIFAAFALETISTARIPIPSFWVAGISLCLLAGGLAIRWTAILTLGRFFSPAVAIQQSHQIVRAGLYRCIRHPCYAGLLLAFSGLAFSFGNWLSFLALVVPVTAALLYRIHVEESALVEALGQDYMEYCKSTRRLLPGSY